MAKKDSEKKAEPQSKPAKPQIPARLVAAVRTVLEDAEESRSRNSVVIGATSYNALRQRALRFDPANCGASRSKNWTMKRTKIMTTRMKTRTRK